jgi:hypothetical protein
MNLFLPQGAVITRPAHMVSRGLVVSAYKTDGMEYGVHEFCNSFVIPAASPRRR